MLLKKLKARLRTGWHLHFKLRHRKRGYQKLRGRGLEIGGFYLPALLPKSCKVEYADAITLEEAREKFPEVRNYTLVKPSYLVDLDHMGLGSFQSGQFDFLVLNHVIEHVANPIFVIEEILRVLKPGGHMVITAPDMKYSVDRTRPLTSFEHLLEEYRAKVTESSDEHYIDFLAGVHPEFIKLPRAELAQMIEKSKERRPHVHVWDSASFKDFLVQTFQEVLKIRLELEIESRGNENHAEYFSVWKKLD